MHHPKLLTRVALAAALSLSASLVAFAGEATDTTEIEVTANGKTEKVRIADLKLGETRQLYSEAGTLVTATRLADSLELDIGGDKTSVKIMEPGAFDEAHIEALIASEGGASADGTKRIIRIHHADDTHGVGDGKDGHAPHVVIKHGDGKGDGKQVIVTRRVVKADEG